MSSHSAIDTVKEISGLLVFLVAVAALAFLLIVSLVVISQEIPFGFLVSVAIMATVIYGVIWIIKKYVTAL